MRIMKLLGISVAIITNAAGGLDPTMDVGTIITLMDHISLPSLVRRGRASRIAPFQLLTLGSNTTPDLDEPSNWQKSRHARTALPAHVGW